MPLSMQRTPSYEALARNAAELGKHPLPVEHVCRFCATRTPYGRICAECADERYDDEPPGFDPD